MALHRPAEFNKSHIPAFLADEEPRAYVCVYPFVRSYEWYLLPDAERRALLAEHGQMARDYPDVRANTVASLRARRLRVDPRLRGRRAAPDRRPDAPPARRRRPAGTSARRSRSTPAAASPSASSSPAWPSRRQMPDDLRVNGWLVIPGSELHERFSRSSGPGGQSVNTADSRVELSFDVGAVGRAARMGARQDHRTAGRAAGRRRAHRGRLRAAQPARQPPGRQGAARRLAQGARSPRRSARASRPGPAGARTSAAWRANASAPRSSAGAASTAGIPSDNYSDGTLTTIASCVDLAITTTASVSGEGFSSRCGTCGGTHT